MSDARVNTAALIGAEVDVDGKRWVVAREWVAGSWVVLQRNKRVRRGHRPEVVERLMRASEALERVAS